jgi:ubiquinone biosynthesis protein Coq4
MSSNDFAEKYMYEKELKDMFLGVQYLDYRTVETSAKTGTGKSYYSYEVVRAGEDGTETVLFKSVAILMTNKRGESYYAIKRLEEKIEAPVLTEEEQLQKIKSVAQSLKNRPKKA